MPALQINSDKNLLTVVYDAGVDKTPTRPLICNPIQPTHDRNTFNRKVLGVRNNFSCMGLTIPFQPCMWDDKTIEASWNDMLQLVRNKMQAKYSGECIGKTIARLKNVFLKLNFNTHRKGLAVLLTSTDEKIIYSGFPVKPVVFFNKSVSVLDLAANIKHEANFYCLMLDKEKCELHENNSGVYRKVYAENEIQNISYLPQRIRKVIELVNNETGNPVFVTGHHASVELFCKNNGNEKTYYPLPFDNLLSREEAMQSVLREITKHWKYWHTKNLRDKIQLAHQENYLVSNIESVLHALEEGTEGVLLIDKNLKKQLTSHVAGKISIDRSAGLISLIERFLINGCKIEITESGMLRDYGGIALLKNFQKPMPDDFRHKAASGDLF